MDSWLKMFKLKEEYLTHKTVILDIIYKIPLTLVYRDIHVNKICIHPKICQACMSNYIYTRQSQKSQILLFIHNTNDINNNKCNDSQQINKIELSNIVDKLIDCYVCIEYYYDEMPEYLLKYFNYHEVYQPIEIFYDE